MSCNEKNLFAETIIHLILLYVKLLNSRNDGNTVNQLQCQVIKDPEKNSGSSWDSNPGPSDY